MQFQHIVEALAGYVSGRGIPPTAIPLVVPPVDDEPDIEPELLGYAEGQSFIIEYTDSAGRSSTRRITVFQIVEGLSGVASLMARCHERKAMRQFRVDRIRACIDFDGVVHEDVPGFLNENFGMSISVATRVGVEGTDGRWARVRSFIKPDAVILSALSHADGHVHQLEREGIEQYLMHTAEHAGWFLNEREIVAMGRFVERLRPNQDAIAKALDAITGRESDDIQRLLRQAVAVMDADGLRHSAELAMLDEFCFDLTGVRIG